MLSKTLVRVLEENQEISQIQDSVATSWTQKNKFKLLSTSEFEKIAIDHYSLEYQLHEMSYYSDLPGISITVPIGYQKINYEAENSLRGRNINIGLLAKTTLTVLPGKNDILVALDQMSEISEFDPTRFNPHRNNIPPMISMGTGNLENADKAINSRLLEHFPGVMVPKNKFYIRDPLYIVVKNAEVGLVWEGGILWQPTTKKQQITGRILDRFSEKSGSMLSLTRETLKIFGVELPPKPRNNKRDFDFKSNEVISALTMATLGLGRVSDCSHER